MPAHEFKPGFRFSITDIVVLCVGGAGVVLLAREKPWKPAMALIGWAARRPAYHGICWQRRNPTLPAWWQARQSKE